MYGSVKHVIETSSVFCQHFCFWCLLLYSIISLRSIEIPLKCYYSLFSCTYDSFFEFWSTRVYCLVSQFFCLSARHFVARLSMCRLYMFNCIQIHHCLAYKCTFVLGSFQISNHGSYDLKKVDRLSFEYLTRFSPLFLICSFFPFYSFVLWGILFFDFGVFSVFVDVHVFFPYFSSFMFFQY